MRQPFVRFLLPTLVVLGISSYAPGVAHAQKAVGQWSVRYERQVASQHGSAATSEEINARMTLRQQGDSVFGEWQVIVAAGKDTAPVHEMRGHVRGDSAFVRLVPVPDKSAGMLATVGHEISEFIKTYVHGMPPMSTVMHFRVQGDSLNGARWNASDDGAVKSRVVALTGARSKP